MVNYQFGKIYKIVDNTNDNCYIGSTCEPTLARRLAVHVSDYKRWLEYRKNYISSYEIIKNGDYDIILIENFPCNSKDELFARERYWTQNTNCVNVRKNQGIIKELGDKDYNHQYYINNKDSLKTKQKIYVEAHKDSIQKYKNDWYEKNKEKILEKCKIVYNEKSLQIYLCGCGSTVRISEKTRHNKSIKHQTYEKQKQ